MRKIKVLLTGFLGFQVVWHLMNAGLAFSQMALLDVSVRALTSLILIAIGVAMWEGEK